METRRGFLAGGLLTGILVCSAGSVRSVGGGITGQMPDERAPQEPQRPGHESPAPEVPGLPDAGKKILEDNDKDMKKKVERLYELASELKQQVDKTDSSKVLSLNLVKKAEEIERLARDIKNRSKG